MAPRPRVNKWVELPGGASRQPIKWPACPNLTGIWVWMSTPEHRLVCVWRLLTHTAVKLGRAAVCEQPLSRHTLPAHSTWRLKWKNPGSHTSLQRNIRWCMTALTRAPTKPRPQHISLCPQSLVMEGCTTT